MKTQVLILNNEDIDDYLEKNADKDIYFKKDEYDINRQFFYLDNAYDDYNGYDVILINVAESEKEDVINAVKEYFDGDEVVVTTNPDDIEYYDTPFLLTVISGSYEDISHKTIGLFKTRKSALDYYHKHCEITAEFIEKNNKQYYEYSKNEPTEEDFMDDNYEIDWDAYGEANAEYWKDKEINYISEDETTLENIKRIEFLD
jgi:hypothetical protein